MDHIVVEVLKKAKALINKGWCQGYFAVNKNGNQTQSLVSNRACKFCASGAILRANLDFLGCIDNIASQAESCLPVKNIIEWNDQRGRIKKQILNAFNKAIKIAKKRYMK